MIPTEHELLAAARTGDRRALEGLLERHQATIYRFAMKLCRDPEDAKDVLQDTMIAMVRGIRDFQGASSLSTWLYTVARSFCLKARRRSKLAPTAERSLGGDAATEAANISDPAKLPDDALAEKRLEAAVTRAIAALQPNHREVFILRDLEGLTAPEVAEVLGISVQAVKSRLHRARLAVRANLWPLLGIPEPAHSAASSCPDIALMFSQNLEGEISASVCSQMQLHLESCDRCRGTCDSLKQTLTLCSTSRASDRVPASVQESVRTALRSFIAELV